VEGQVAKLLRHVVCAAGPHLKRLAAGSSSRCGFGEGGSGGAGGSGSSGRPPSGSQSAADGETAAVIENQLTYGLGGITDDDEASDAGDCEEALHRLQLVCDCGNPMIGPPYTNIPGAALVRSRCSIAQLMLA
jgi:hypothetical protein